MKLKLPKPVWKRVNWRLGFIGVCLLAVAVLLVVEGKGAEGVAVLLIALGKFFQAQWDHAIGYYLPRRERNGD